MNPGLAMLQMSSSKLVELIGRRLEVQFLNQQNFDFTIVELQALSCFKVHEFTWILVQTCSMMIPDDELSNEYANCVKKFERKVRYSRSRSENNECC
jgi:hypothetical protein